MNAGRPNTRRLLPGLLLVGLVVVAYVPFLDAGFIWDDDQHVTKNAALQSVDGLVSLWQPSRHTTPQYYPLTFTLFWVGHQLWGIAPFGYHLLNIVLHAANVVLLWMFLRKISFTAAWLAAALFAVHPLHVMSVAWVTELKNVLSGFFLLLALHSYPLFTDRNGSGSTRAIRTAYLLSFLFFLCAMCSKTAAAFFPVAVLLLRWWHTGRLRRSDLLPLSPFIAVALAGGALTFWIEQGVVGAGVDEFSPSWAARVAMVGHAFWFYVAKHLWPVSFEFIYPPWATDPSRMRSYGYTALMLAALVFLYRGRHQFGRGPFAAMLYFTLTAPALVLVHVLYMMRYTPVANHWAYFASPALLALLGGALHGTRRRLGIPPAPACAATALLLGTLVALTWAQRPMFQDAKSLWQHTLARQPDSWMAHINLGVLYAEQKDYADAERHYRAALSAHPGYAKAHNNLGVLYHEQGRLSEAQAELEDAVRLEPTFLRAHHNLGRVLDDQQAHGAAERQFRLVLEGRPDFLPSRRELAENLLRQERYPEAAAAYWQVLRMAPDDAVARGNLGVALLRTGDTFGAARAFENALQLAPGFADAHNNLAGILAQRGRLPEAIAHFREATVLSPDDAGIYLNLGQALAESGDRAGAEAAFQRALDLRPGWPRALEARRALAPSPAPSNVP